MTGKAVKKERKNEKKINIICKDYESYKKFIFVCMSHPTLKTHGVEAEKILTKGIKRFLRKPESVELLKKYGSTLKSEGEPCGKTI